jgi:hypothetical protein
LDTFLNEEGSWAQALPRLRGGDHIGITLQDMRRVHVFLVDVMRCAYVWSLARVGRESQRLGQRSQYFLSPSGMQFELVSFPDGKSYEKEAAVKLWHRRHLAD